MLQFLIGFLFGAIITLVDYTVIVACKFNEKEVNKYDKRN